MHIYYYYKDSYYYVMNENGILEKYSVKNNIELILQSENLINYFNVQLKEENTKFHFKAYQELMIAEKQNLSQFIPLLALFEYHILQENTISAIILQISVLNILNKIYYNKKSTTQKAENILENLLRELLTELNNNLESLKQISHCQKEIAPLSELDPNQSKTYLKPQDELIDNYQYDMDIKIDLEINPENIFNNDIYEKLLEYDDVDKEELDYQRKIKIIRDKYLKELPEEVQLKLDIIGSKYLIDSIYLFANGTLSLAMILQLIKQNFNIEFLNSYQDNILTIVIILNIISYYIYYRTNKKIKNTNEPVLKLEKDNK